MSAKSYSCVRYLSWFASILILGHFHPLEAAPQELRKTYYLVFQGEPAAEVHARLKGKQSPQQVAVAADARRAAIKSEQEKVVAQLHARGHLVSGRFSHVVNALRIHIPPGAVKELRSLPGVKRIEAARPKERLLSRSVPFIGGPQVWGAGFGQADGNGIRIGIIDTGIDYTHADFGGSGSGAAYLVNNRTIIEPGTFPTAKVVGGYDFVGDDYDASTPGLDVPYPDLDPLDCNGHGTHVAGIAAGFGVRTNGLVYTGSYSTNLNYSQFAIGPGVAPRALLYALKVFGCEGSTHADIDAMEWAATAGTGSFANHLDVVNLSIGGVFGVTGDSVENDAITQLINLGCIVVVAAGNSGNTSYIVGLPGVVEKSICVANSMIGGAIQIVSPGNMATAMAAVEADFTLPLSHRGPVQGKVVYASPNDACNPLNNSAALAGNIALIDRGTCFFTDKIERAQTAGAIGVVVVNNVDEEPFPMNGTPTVAITIPAVMIRQSDGAFLKAHLVENPIVRMGTDVIVAHPEFSDRIESSSSRGPAAPLNVLKPDLAAPGSGIYSAAMASGSAGVTMTGTSMAAPHVAGASAVLRQLHPGWSVEEIKAALMGTARPMQDNPTAPYPESRVGAGRIRLNEAARVAVTAKAQNSDGLVTMNLGALELSESLVRTQQVVLLNHGNVAVSYTVAVSNTVTEPGFNVVPLQTQVTVPANSSILVPVQFHANPVLFDRTGDPTTPSFIGAQPAQKLFEASGQIWFLNSSLSIHVPYYASVRAGSKCWADLKDLAFPVDDTPLDVTLPLFGSSAHPQPLVSAFQLGATSADLNAYDPVSASLDVLAVGAATDAASQSQLANSTLYFGVAVASNWTAPQTFIADLRVQIDSNSDGFPELELLASTSGNASDANLYEGGACTSVFQSIVTDYFGSFISAAGYLNVFPANVRDTAPFNNSVLVLSVPVASLGLSPGNSLIKYRAVAIDINNWEVDGTDWATLDVAQPVLDTTVYGISNTPFFADGNPLKVRISRTSAANNGFAANGSAGLLLLHHFNRAGSKRETINFHLEQNSNIPLKILPPTIVAGGRKLSWTSVPNAVYTVEYSTNLAQGFPFQAATSLSGAPPLNSFVDAVPRGNTVFYRIRRQ
jgi:subtilisin family serine protease